MADQQFTRSPTDPPGCSGGFVPHPFKRQTCSNCSKPALQHSSATDEQILLAIQLSLSDSPSEILPGLYVSGYKAAMSLGALEKAGITHVINTAKGIKDFFPTFKEHPERCQYLHLDMLDTETEDLSGRLTTSLTFISDSIQGRGRVLVHCMQGKSRSGSVAVAYVMVAEGLGYEEALKVVQLKRPVVEPNNNFERQLKEFEVSELCRELRRTLGRTQATVEP